jgi:hypothetical protein
MLNTIEEEANNEPVEFRGQSKAKIYQILAVTYFLPDKESRCVTRQYLAAVHRGEVYRLERVELLNFEVQLSFEEKRKASFFHLGLLRQKADVLLGQLGMLPFGFPPNTMADEVWFGRVLRLIDPYNVCGGYRQKVRGAVPPRTISGRM